MQLLNTFIKENIRTDGGGLILVSDFVGAVRWFAMRHGTTPPKRDEILSALREAGYGIGLAPGHRGNAVIGLSVIGSRPRYELVGDKIVRNPVVTIR
jgi:hypothetical protein